MQRHRSCLQPQHRHSIKFIIYISNVLLGAFNFIFSFVASRKVASTHKYWFYRCQSRKIIFFSLQQQCVTNERQHVTRIISHRTLELKKGACDGGIDITYTHEAVTLPQKAWQRTTNSWTLFRVQAAQNIIANEIFEVFIWTQAFVFFYHIFGELKCVAKNMKKPNWNVSHFQTYKCFHIVYRFELSFSCLKCVKCVVPSTIRVFVRSCWADEWKFGEW